MGTLGNVIFALAALGGVLAQNEICCSPETFESDLIITGSLLGVDLKLTNAKLSVDQTRELIALQVSTDGILPFPLFEAILDFPQEKVYLSLPLVANLCFVSNSSYPFTRSCATDGNSLLSSDYIGSGEEQLRVQLWDKNKPNITHTQVRTDMADGTCYLVSETFQAEGFSMTLDFTNMVSEVDDSVFTPPNSCIDSFDLLNGDSDRLPREVRELITRGLDFY